MLSPVSQSHSEPLDPSYTRFLEAQRAHFAAIPTDVPLFTVHAPGLWDAFLAALPATERQHHTCNACRHFVERYGNLVTIDDGGRTHAAMWGEAPGFYGSAFAVLRASVERAPVTGVFLSSDPVWGTPVTGAWHHMAVTPSKAQLYRATPLKNAAQAMAEKREEYGMLCRGLAEFNAATVAQALTVVSADALYRGEKVEGVVRWLSELHAVRATHRGAYRDNVTWLAVARAPIGYAHVKTTMVGTLLEDIAAGLTFDQVKARFAEKMHPLRYQRPQAAPSAGQIAQAEKAMEALGAAGALRRRFARIDEVVAIWRPTVETPSAPAGVFGHLKPKGVPATPALAVTAPPMTWVKFRDLVLPGATKIEVFVPSRAAFYAFLTATDPTAPPILQWDREDQRNPVSVYTYYRGSRATQWGLHDNTWVTVTGVTLRPHQWFGGAFPHQGEGAFFLLEGCVDSHKGAGNAIFPENLKSEYHGIRATIEAYSRTAEIDDRDQASACGVGINKGGDSFDAVTLRVTTRTTGPVTYKLDRWD